MRLGRWFDIVRMWVGVICVVWCVGLGVAQVTQITEGKVRGRLWAPVCVGMCVGLYRVS